MSKPKTEPKVIYSERCEASWQIVSIDGSRYTIKCRRCGVHIADGGTPKCLNNEVKQEIENR